MGFKKKMCFLIFHLTLLSLIVPSVIAQNDKTDHYYCTRLQPLIDGVAKAVVAYDGRREWKRSVNVKAYLERYPGSEDEAKLYLNIVMAIMDWGESVDKFQN